MPNADVDSSLLYNRWVWARVSFRPFLSTIWTNRIRFPIVEIVSTIIYKYIQLCTIIYKFIQWYLTDIMAHRIFMLFYSLYYCLSGVSLLIIVMSGYVRQ